MDLGDGGEVFVGRQHHQVVPNAQLREQGIDGCDLDAPGDELLQRVQQPI